MNVMRSLLLFVTAALAEIGGAWLVWQGVREHRGWAWVGAGVIALGIYGFVATLQPNAHFGRIWRLTGECLSRGPWPGARPSTASDRTGGTFVGALVCLFGVTIIMYVPRPAGA